MLRALRICIVLFAALSAATASAEDRLTIISPHWEGVRYEFERGFIERYRKDTGRDAAITWLDVGGTSEILRFVTSEFRSKPQGIGVDLVFGGGTDPFENFKGQGVLEAYRLPSTILDRIPQSLAGAPIYDPDFTWYAPTMAGFGILCNREVLHRLGLEVPSTWEDLGAARLRTWIGSGDPRHSGSMHMAYEIILQAYGWTRGWELLQRIGSNIRGFTQSSTQTGIDVALGEVACGFAIDSQAWAQMQEVGTERLSFTMPEGFTVVNGDGLAILKGAPDPQLARRFVDFAMSEEGQKLWLLKRGTPGGPERNELSRFSILPDLYGRYETNVALNPFTWRTGFKYDSSLGSKRWSIVNDLIGTFIIEPMAAGGRAVVPPVGEEEISEILSSGRWNNPLERTRIVRAWKEAAAQAVPPRSLLWSALPLALLLVLTLLAALGRRKRRLLTPPQKEERQ